MIGFDVAWPVAFACISDQCPSMSTQGLHQYPDGRNYYDLSLAQPYDLSDKAVGEWAIINTTDSKCKERQNVQ